MRPGCQASGTLFDLPTKRTRKKELEVKMGETNFWDHQEIAKPVVAEVKILKAQIEPIDAMFQSLDDVASVPKMQAACTS